ncbi:MAG: RpiB/LacA/LacB family sugar-phosphate isomerase [bacterium]|nr:RpiB/LacA/LacB family sugar-phosphate isomerase [bacterium]
MNIYLAADHAGFALKEEIKQHLIGRGVSVQDFGATSLDPDDDYPDFVIPLARKVATEKESRGIILGGSGQGETIAANKILGVRAALYYGGPMDIVRLSRQHNDANVLSLGARFITKEEAIYAVTLWLETEFDGGRHERRLKKIEAIEQ